MVDYRQMYFTLFCRVSEAIHSLMRAQQEAEETYMAGKEPEKED